jgi:hypothetical protein
VNNFLNNLSKINYLPKNKFNLKKINEKITKIQD